MTSRWESLGDEPRSPNGWLDWALMMLAIVAIIAGLWFAAGV